MSAPLTAERIQQIQARVDAATEGPWNHHDFGYAGEQEPSIIAIHQGAFDWQSIRDGHRVAFTDWAQQPCQDADFIAHARSDIPALLAEVERLTAEVADCAERNEQLRLEAEFAWKRQPVPAPVVADPDTEVDAEAPWDLSNNCEYCGHNIFRHGPLGLPEVEGRCPSQCLDCLIVAERKAASPAPVTVRADELTAEHIGRTVEIGRTFRKTLVITGAPRPHDCFTAGCVEIPTAGEDRTYPADTPVTLLPEGGDNHG